MILWISSYPKSGNTWIRTFLSTYYFSKSDEFNFDLLKNIRQFPHKKFFDTNINSIELAINNWDKAQSDINSKNKIVFLKTHSALVKINDIPFTSKRHSLGSIYIIRDPRNIITSMSNHYQLNFDEALKFMIDEKKFLIDSNTPNNFGNFTFLNSWSNHYKSWMENKEFKTFFVKYEDLESNAQETFYKIIVFINRLTGVKEEINIERVNRIIESVNFERLKMKEEKDGFPEAISNKKKIKFFYLGKKNNWRNLLKKSQLETLNSTFKLDLDRLKY